MFELILLLSLLIVGYGFGSYREKQHYKSIFEREETLSNIMLFESRFLPESDHVQGGALVTGHVVVSVDYFKRFVAGLRKLVGGPITQLRNAIRSGASRGRTSYETRGTRVGCQ